mgnify:CR=1 FL=1
MEYYIKKLGHQELGSIKEDGRPSRGRYIYISKNKEVLKFFPPMSEKVVNDNVVLPIISVELRKKVYCNFVYHNDKISRGLSNGRNEYRLYLNTDIENHQLLFKENDIVIFKSVRNEYDNEYSNLYYLLRFSKENKSDINRYNFLDKIIESSNLIRGHAIVNEKIDFIEQKINEVELDENVEIVVPTQVIERTQEFIGTTSSIENLFNSQSFRDFVMVGYGNKCAVTGKSIIWKKFTNLEAAHIMPKSHNGTYMPNNGLALSRDIHWAFDKGFFTINDDYTIKVHEELMNTYLGEFEGKKINLPENPFFIPDKENLRYHRENIFGLFKCSGRISSVNIN